MHNWEYNLRETRESKLSNFILFILAAASALLVYFVFYSDIKQFNDESSLLINLFFIPSLAIGFLYGMRITEKAMKPSEERSPIKRIIVKIFLFFFVIGSLFSSVSFAMNGGSIMPTESFLGKDPFVWIIDYITQNGGATFLIVTSITLMAAATKKLIRLDGLLNKTVTFISTFTFFAMLSLSFLQSDPTNSEVYLYTFYQAGIIGGALYEMNRLTKNLNSWEDYTNGYL
jgi:magnesium-transporting ATPase (P-type)